MGLLQGRDSRRNKITAGLIYLGNTSPRRELFPILQQTMRQALPGAIPSSLSSEAPMPMLRPRSRHGWLFCPL